MNLQQQADIQHSSQGHSATSDGMQDAGEGKRTALRFVRSCVRTCIGCFKKSPQNELIRIVRLPNKEVVLDRSTLPGSEEKGPRPAGRSVYLCRDLACFTKAAKTHKNKNAFQGRLHVPVGPAVLEMLRKELEGKKK